MEMFKQPQNSPYPVEDQVASLWAGTTGKFDDVKTEDVQRFEAEWLEYMHRNHGEFMMAIRESGKLADDGKDVFAGAMDNFRKQFQASSDHGGEGSEQFDEIAADHINQEKITKHKP